MSALNRLPFAMQDKSGRGFTLIEVIITLVLMGFMAAMFSTLFTNAFLYSAQPMQTLQQDVNLSQVMEELIETWNEIGDDIISDDLVTLKGTIGAEGTTGSINGVSYYVVNNHFVIYNNSGVETNMGAAKTSFLKVTIRSTSDSNKQSLTFLFTTRSSST